MATNRYDFTEETEGWRVWFPDGTVSPITLTVREQYAGPPGETLSRLLDRVTAACGSVGYVDTSVRWALAGLARTFADQGSRCLILAPGEVPPAPLAQVSLQERIASQVQAELRVFAGELNTPETAEKMKEAVSRVLGETALPVPVRAAAGEDPTAAVFEVGAEPAREPPLLEAQRELLALAAEFGQRAFEIAERAYAARPPYAGSDSGSRTA